MSDLTIAIASNLVSGGFFDVINNFKAEKTGTGGSGNFTLGYDVAFHFRHDLTDKPTIELRDDGTVFIHDLKILWDKLEVTLGISIPELDIGGFCIIPNPRGGCLVRAPVLHLFGGHPDISVTLALDGFVNSELSIKAGVKPVHFNNPDRQPTESDWDAHANKHANQWRLALDAPIVDVQPIDISDTVADLFKKTIEDGLDGIIGGLPGWAKDFIKSVLGGVEWIIRTVLGIPDKISQWLETQFQVPGNLLSLIESGVMEFLEQKFALPLTEDPVPFDLPNLKLTQQTLIPFMLPIASLDATVSSAEIVLQGSLG